MQKNKFKFSQILLAGTLVLSTIYLGGADGCFGSSTGSTGSYSAGSSGTSSGTGVTCPTESGRTLCGYCDSANTSSGNIHANMCRYCPSQDACKYTDICTDLTCPTSGSGGGVSGGGGSTSGTCDKALCQSGGFNCCVSCSGCQAVGGVDTTPPVANFVDSVTCLATYNYCVQVNCSKILDNCR